jgi:hypothetical protein
MHNKYINDRPQKGLRAGPSLLRSSSHYVMVKFKVINAG